MKTFEEKFTAWVDGKLSGEERLAFEKQLADLPQAEAEREEVLILGRLLRAQETPALSNEDFFNLQIAQRIQADSQRPAPLGLGRARRSFWSFPGLLWAGGACLVAAAALFSWLVPDGPPGVSGAESPYFAQIVEAWPGEPGVSASTVYTERDKLTVVWLDGLEYIPASYELK